jgi:hypothetical protein
MYLGQGSDEFSFSQIPEIPLEIYSVPEYSGGWYSGGVYDPPPEYNPNVYGPSGGTWSSTPSQSTGSWWDTFTGALVPISQAAANIIRAVGGQPVTTSRTPIPSGYTRNAQGQLVPIPGSQAGFNVQSLLLPAVLGVGAYMLLKKGKRR